MYEKLVVNTNWWTFWAAYISFTKNVLYAYLFTMKETLLYSSQAQYRDSN